MSFWSSYEEALEKHVDPVAAKQREQESDPFFGLKKWWSELTQSVASEKQAGAAAANVERMNHEQAKPKASMLTYVVIAGIGYYVWRNR